MSMYEIVCDDITSLDNEKCTYCYGKFIAVTKCCNIKLCQFHLRHQLEDEILIECSKCMEDKIEIIPFNGSNAWTRKDGTIYCKNHNNDKLVKCLQCDLYFCKNHNHICDK